MGEASPVRGAAPTLTLDAPVQYLPGVGPRRAAALAELGIETVGDLLTYFPFRHEQFQPRLITHLEPEESVTIIGRLSRIRVQGFGRSTSVRATITDNTGHCSVRWFNAGYVADRLETGLVARLTGRVELFDESLQLVNPRMEILDPETEPVREDSGPLIEPIYPGSAKCPSAMISRLLRPHLQRIATMLGELHAPGFLAKRGLPGRHEAVVAMHRPTDVREVETARQRLAYDELLALQLVVVLARRARRMGSRATPLPVTPAIDERIRARLPFRPTPGQEAAVSEISADLARSQPMHRLLQGDVGSGKTLVAMYAALTAIANRSQVAVMAPTELLAEQLYCNFDRYLAGSRVRRALLTGSARQKQRRENLSKIAVGELDLVVGTQALLEEDVEFNRLGLVIVDEQHRFGVRQRMTIRCKGPSPHYLVMTATPIPRTLAMTVFGDLDVSTIRGLPPGRSPIVTRTVGPARIDEAWAFVRGRVAAGEQAFVVYPLVEESDALPLKSATAESRRLARDVFAGTNVGLIHGRMKSDEKDRVMAEFVAGRTPILVSTTVVEVGIDVPAATVMVIQHANRYGLSQLHQLRGRVGRGERPGFCLLMTDSAADAENERLNVLVRTTDGFEIAEEDLRLRGPGELLGTRQHGVPELQVADLITDIKLLQMAQRDAATIVDGDPTLAKSEHRALREFVTRRYGDRLELAATG